MNMLAFSDTTTLNLYILGKIYLDAELAINADDKDIERWVEAFGFETHYEVSSFGRVRSIGRTVPCGGGNRTVKSKIRTQCINKSNKTDKVGRLTVSLSMYNKSITLNVSRLIYCSFNPKEIISSDECITHVDNAFDNSIDNLVHVKYNQIR